MIKIVRTAFHDNNKYYAQMFLDECLSKLYIIWKFYIMIELMFLKELMLIREECDNRAWHFSLLEF